MESIKILEFISDGCGDGLGCGAGRGYNFNVGRGAGNLSEYSDNTGYGNGSDGRESSGAGYARGSGRGWNCENNSGYGSCLDYDNNIKSIDGKEIYIVDDVATIINHVYGNIAKGAIINKDLTKTPCYIAKEGRYFAHGETLVEAVSALQDKLLKKMPVEKRITTFWECHKKGVKYPTKDFFEWHHKLTGSCLMGRQQFAKAHDVDLEGEMTVEEFIELTKNAFGGDIIRRLEDKQ